MSDRDLIIRLLNAAECRIRRNRILNETVAGLAIALLIPVAFKLVDLISPFRLTTVAIFLGLWTVVTLIWLATRTRRRDSLENIAAKIDQAADSHDQIKTAYWFMRNPSESLWVEAQIEHAAQNAGKLQVASLYPRHVPRAFYAAAFLVLLFGVLNYLPLSMNPNWLHLKGAPAFRLNEAQKDELQKALELLKKAEALHETDLTDKLAGIVRALNEGSLSQSQLGQDLSDLRQSLAEGDLNAGQITDGLERIAKALDSSALTKPIASGLFVLNLKDAAKDVRKIGERPDKDSSAAAKEMSERFQDAAGVAGKELQQLSQELNAAAAALSQRDSAAGRQALERTAKEFERLQGLLDSQRLLSQASAQIDALADSVGNTPGEKGQAQGKGEGQGEGQGAGRGERGRGQGEGVGQGEGQGEGQGAEGVGDAEGDQPGRGNGNGGKQAGLTGPLPMRGEATTLDVQFEKEALPIKPTRGSRPESIEEASQRERSKLDLSKVPSELSKTQKDLLNQDSAPLEQQQLLKQYFETIRP